MCWLATRCTNLFCMFLAYWVTIEVQQTSVPVSNVNSLFPKKYVSESVTLIWKKYNTLRLGGMTLLDGTSFSMGLMLEARCEKAFGGMDCTSTRWRIYFSGSRVEATINWRRSLWGKECITLYRLLWGHFHHKLIGLIRTVLYIHPPLKRGYSAVLN